MRLNLISRGRTRWQRELHLTFTSASPLKVQNPGQSRGAFKVETPECRKQPAQIATLVASQRQLEPAGIALSHAAEFAIVSGASAEHYPAARVPGRGHRPRLGR